jgi:hypothetical protein
MRLAVVGVAALLAGCSVIDRRLDEGIYQLAEAMVGMAAAFHSAALSLSLPGLAVGDRIESGAWPTRERLDELLVQVQGEASVCELSVIAATDLEYRIEYSIVDPESGQCSYALAASARHVEAEELCFESSVWLIDAAAREPVETQGDLICESTLANIPVPFHVLFAPGSAANDETSERVRQRLRELLSSPPDEPQ